jgi:hypothetical protein
MYIISKFHDYYDGIMKQGMDKSLVYQRTEETISSKSFLLTLHYYTIYDDLICDRYWIPSSNRKYPVSTDGKIEIEIGLLGFCGHQYLVLLCNHLQSYALQSQIKSCSYQRWLEKLKGLSFENCTKNAFQLIENNLTTPYNSKNYHNKRCISHANVERIFKQYHGTKLNDDFFIELNCPIFLIADGLIIKNPPLQQLDFQCVFNSEECFQEISHYLGNVLTQPDNPSQITDNKVLCSAKGFDVKTSFRKAPTKHKK